MDSFASKLHFPQLNCTLLDPGPFLLRFFFVPLFGYVILQLFHQHEGAQQRVNPAVVPRIPHFIIRILFEAAR
jgi:hypothetical protein